MIISANTPLLGTSKETTAIVNASIAPARKTFSKPKVIQIIPAKATLEQQLAREIWCGAYPYGEEWQLNDHTTRAAAEAGLKACFTQVPGAFDTHHDPHFIPRLGIAPRDDFYLKISGILDNALCRRLLHRNT